MYAHFWVPSPTWCWHFQGKWAQKTLQSRRWTVRIWNPHGHASSHFEAVARQIRSSKVVVDGRHKNQSGLFYYLSGARAAPGVGQLGKGRYLFGFLGRFSAENDYGAVHFFELLWQIFRKYRETSEFGNFGWAQTCLESCNSNTCQIPEAAEASSLASCYGGLN